MVDLAAARGMQVITADGELIGTVEDATPDGLVIDRLGASAGDKQAVPAQWIEKIDRQVHLNRSGAEAVAGWRSAGFTQDHRAKPATHEARPGLGNKWILLLLVLLVIVTIIMMLGSR